MAISLPRLPATPPSHAQFQVWWQEVAEAIEKQEGGQDELIEALAAAVAAIAAAQAAADSANAAAAAAQTVADNIVASDELRSSYVDGTNVLIGSDAGTDATITIAAHDRKYPQGDGSTVTVAVGGGALTGLAYSTQYFVYYDDPTRAGGAVTYAATTSASTAAQTGARHLVGSVVTPAALGAPTPGGTVRPPGVGTLEALE